MAQTIEKNRTEYQFHAATEEEIQQALQQEANDNRLKNVGMAILKVLMLPILFVVFALKWIGTFCVRASAWIFYLSAGLMSVLAIIYLTQRDGSNAIIGFIIGIVIFLIPSVAAFLVAVLGGLQIRLHDFIWSQKG